MLLDFDGLMGNLGSAATVPPIRCSCNYAGSFHFCVSLCKAIRNRRLISVCFCLPCKASRISESVLWFSFNPIKVVFSLIHFFLASLSGTVDFRLPL